MAAPSVDDLARSFERYLRAGNKSPWPSRPTLRRSAAWPPTSGRALDQPVPVLTEGRPAQA